MAVAHTHALFTWIETDLRNSQMLPGPEPHAWNDEQPAYEFPTGHENTRVLVRRVQRAMLAHRRVGRRRRRREVTVTVPDLGACRILARPAGTVHRVEQVADRRKVTWLDRNAMQPSLSVRQ